SSGSTAYSSRLALPGKSPRRASTAKQTQVPANNQAPASSKLVGQTETLLPSGRLLSIGGQGSDGPERTASIGTGQPGQTVQLPSGLHHTRSWHSATMLPDGRILVLGGIGREGEVVAEAEVFDPETQTFQPMPAIAATPRAYHTATLLTDGHVL